LIADPRMRISRIGFVGHNDICRDNTQTTKVNDPGMEFDWELFEARELGLLRGATPAIASMYQGYFITDGAVVSAGTTGQQAVIREIQNDVRSIGYGGAANGVYSSSMEWLVRRFQGHFFTFTDYSQRTGRVNRDTARMIKSVVAGLPSAGRSDLARSIRARRMSHDPVWRQLFPRMDDFVPATPGVMTG
jgi:N-acetyl-anhydromuramyl-L-alanine amidase AmpD